AASDSAAKACPAVIVYFVQRELSKTSFRNYLFSDTPKGADASAIVYTRFSIVLGKGIHDIIGRLLKQKFYLQIIM
ncbi:MAG: hypothetical protein K2N98_10315, partial [Lachnospiraceae bacterium]|nr:hypothetical protein [Lachnospiraceae bacterium]